MSQWRNSDNAANSVNYVAAQLNKVANTGNRTALFNNTTTGAFVTNQKTGVFGVSADETQALRAGANTKVAHAGWNLRIEGTGGRAGRVSYETLVAMGSITGDAADDAIVPDFRLRFTTSPVSASGNATASQIVAFNSVGNSTPAGATLTYFWQRWTGSAFANLTNTGAYSNTGTPNLSIASATAPSTDIVRAGIVATGADPVFTANATFTRTT